MPRHDDEDIAALTSTLQKTTISKKSGMALTFGFNSAATNGNGQRAVTRLDRSGSGQRAEADLPNVPGDVLAVTELLRDHFDMKVKQHLVGHGPRWEQMDKRKVVGILGNLFKCDASTLFIYVAGHGEGDEDSEDPMLGKGGNWIIDNYNNPNDKKYKTISLREIMTLWLAAKKKRTDSPKLVITMDVCFAGTWVEELKAIEDELRDSGSETCLDVAVQASTMHNQCATDGFFTEIFVQKQLAPGTALRQQETAQYPTYHCAWRGPRGGKIDNITFDNGKKLKFYAHPRAK